MTADADPDAEAEPGRRAGAGTEAGAGDRRAKAPSTTGLVVEGLAKAYGDFRLGPLDLAVGREVLAVLGPSGCGKTTLLSLVAGIATPDGGSVFLDGRRLDGLPPEDRGTGLVFQDGALFPHMTARENVAYAAEDPDRVDSLADTFEIADCLDRRAADLSGGERQRVALARALAADPDALLLDEPLANLDAPIRRRLREHLHGVFADLPIPVVYVTHDQRAATALGDRIAVLSDGSIEQVAPPEGILERPATPFVAAFTGGENVFEADVGERTGDGHPVLDADGLRLRTRTDAPPGDRVTVCVRPSRVRVLAAGSDPDPGAVALRGTVARRINEGDHFRVTVDHPSGRSLVASVRPGLVDELGLGPGTDVCLAVDPGDVHVIRG